jgi:dienelactone hydrolase
MKKFILIFLFALATPAAEETPNAFLQFVKKRATALRAMERTPETLAEWQAQRAMIRKKLLRAWGGFPDKKCELKPRILGTDKRDGYRVERIIFQTLPGVWMTANAYVPDGPGPRPTVLCVHGHWSGAKQDRTVQARCIGLAKLGFFALAVDALGAGERGIGKALGEYHGEMVAATLWPVGQPLSGLQVYENMRAVDYLLTRKEVDGERLGITGTSGGGNQTMYAGAWDERFKAVVPVCSVGNYQAYLGVACCMCEVVPGALRFTEEWGVLSLTAPRALMVINATQDGIQFSVGEAKKSLALTRTIYALHGKPNSAKHLPVESKHDYNEPMREAMYGWMTLHLKGEGNGVPIDEPKIETVDPEKLRCFPGQTRPDDWLTIPQLAAREGRRLVAQLEQSNWAEDLDEVRHALDVHVLGGAKPRPTRLLKDGPESPTRLINFSPEPGIRLTANETLGQAPRKKGRVIFLSLDGEVKLAKNKLAAAVQQSGRTVVSLSLRATGQHAYPRDAIRRAPDHNTAEWSLWLGQPLLGQWVRDLRTLLDQLGNEPVTLIGNGPAGVVALCAAALDERIAHTVTIGSLASYISDVPYTNQRLGLMAPNMLREAGDIPNLAALIAPRKLTIAGAVHGSGKALTAAELKANFNFTGRFFKGGSFTVLSNGDDQAILRILK